MSTAANDIVGLEVSAPRGKASLANYAIGLFSLAVGGAAILFLPHPEGRFRGMPSFEVQSPAFFPALIASLLIALGIASLVAARRDAAPVSDTSDDVTSGAARMSALVLGYAVLIYVIGFLPASVIAIVGFSLAFGYRNFLVLALVAVAFPYAVELLFARAVHVILPAGVLF